ncbi:MAG: hypothetical protein JWP27_1891, partial [Flaviaesturariibacter sp.]|nr:hypothetical protein [Flaviaesturariibacter sp.]
WLAKVDAFLDGNSWDRTWSQMAKHIETTIGSASRKEIAHDQQKVVA